MLLAMVEGSAVRRLSLFRMRGTDEQRACPTWPAAGRLTNHALSSSQEDKNRDRHESQRQASLGALAWRRLLMAMRLGCRRCNLQFFPEMVDAYTCVLRKVVW